MKRPRRSKNVSIVSCIPFCAEQFEINLIKTRVRNHRGRATATSHSRACRSRRVRGFVNSRASARRSREFCSRDGYTIILIKIIIDATFSFKPSRTTITYNFLDLYVPSKICVQRVYSPPQGSSGGICSSVIAPHIVVGSFVSLDTNLHRKTAVYQPMARPCII